MSGAFDDHLPWIRDYLAVNPAAALAVSIDHLRHAGTSHTLGLDLIEDFARELDVTAIDASLATDVLLFREALAVLGGRTPILGMSYTNFSINVRDCGWDMSMFASEQAGIELLASILKAVPRLDRIITERPALVPF